MRIEFNVTGAKRKELAASLSELMDMPAEYQYMPTCAYKISYFTVTKDGALEFDEQLTEEQLGKLMEFLNSRGFTAAEMPTAAAESENEENSRRSRQCATERKSGAYDRLSAGQGDGQQPYQVD